MKVTFDFDTEDDQENLEIFLQALKLRQALIDLGEIDLEIFKKIIKDNNITCI